MSRIHSSAGAYRQPCGCVIQRMSENVERVFKLRDCCAKEFNERHEASATERAADRDRINGIESSAAATAHPSVQRGGRASTDTDAILTRASGPDGTSMQGFTDLEYRQIFSVADVQVQS